MKIKVNTLKSAQNNVRPLTPREIEVLELISYGWTINEIAEQLYLSTHTIISHRKHLLSKLNAKNTASLVRIGFERGNLTF